MVQSTCTLYPLNNANAMLFGMDGPKLAESSCSSSSRDSKDGYTSPDSSGSTVSESESEVEAHMAMHVESDFNYSTSSSGTDHDRSSCDSFYSSESEYFSSCEFKCMNC